MADWRTQIEMAIADFRTVATIAGVRPVEGDIRCEYLCAAHRVNVYVPAIKGNALLSLLESFLQARLKPRYEGRSDAGG